MERGYSYTIDTIDDLRDYELSEQSMPREIFFKNLEKSISSISSFDDLKILVSDPDTNFSISQ